MERLVSNQYSCGRVVPKYIEPEWKEYETWREHCPHSITIEWNRRLTVNVFERPRHFKSYTTGQIAERFGGCRFRKLAAEIAEALYGKRTKYREDQATKILETMAEAIKYRKENNRRKYAVSK